MKLILVDDEIVMLDIIKKKINFRELSIQEVFEAYNIDKAYESITNNDIDIVICDIEMPGGNGLELMQKFVDAEKAPLFIFLTAHNDFQYIQDACGMHCFHYLLKPILFEDLEKVIKDAVLEIDKKRKESVLIKIGENWNENYDVLLEQFWHNIFTQKQIYTKKDFLKFSESYGMEIDENEKYIPVLFASKGQALSLGNWLFKEISFGLNNIAQEILSDLVCNLYYLDERCFVGLFYLNDNTVNDEIFEDILQNYFQLISKHINVYVCGYVAQACFAWEVQNRIYELVDLEYNNVNAKRNILFAKNIALKWQYNYERPNLEMWQMLFEDAKIDEIVFNINNCTAKLSEIENLRIEYLLNLKSDFLQTVSVILAKNNYVLSDIIKDKLTVERAHLSIGDMNNFMIDTMTNLFFKVYGKKIKEKTCVEKIQQFIEVNIFSNFSRKDIANHVNFNQDYVSRIFKSETGMTLNDYIQKRKIENAKLLLSETNLSIGEISSKLGYENFAYFSQFFKNFVGCSAKEYRKNNSNN